MARYTPLYVQATVQPLPNLFGCAHPVASTPTVPRNRLFVSEHRVGAAPCHDPCVRSTNMNDFDAQAFLDSAGLAREIVAYRRSETLFSQGDAGDTVFYIQKGGVKLSAVSKAGREAVVAMLGPGDFVGEGCLAGQAVRMATATAMTPTTGLVIDKN